MFAVGQFEVALPLHGQLDITVGLFVQQPEAFFRVRAGIVHPHDKIHAAALAHIQQARFVRLGGDLHDAVAVQILTDQTWHIAQGCGVKLFGTDLIGRHHLLRVLVKTQQHAGQIVAGNAGPAIQHQIMPAVRTHTRRHRGAAGEPIGGKAHNSHLLEAALFIHGQQFDLHAAVLQRRHQDQVLIAAAGDILHQILLVLLLQDRGKHAVGVGIHSQIMVALCRCITHHQLGGIAGLQLGQPHRLYRVCKALYVLAHMPDVGIILLQDGNAHVGALGGGVKHGGILPAVTVQILQQERRKQVALHGIFELCALPQPVVQGSLHIAVIAGKLGRTQKLLHLHLFTGHAAACQKQAQQHASQPPAKMIRMFQPLRLLCVENLSGQRPKTCYCQYTTGRAQCQHLKMRKRPPHSLLCSSPFGVSAVILRSCQTSLFLLRRSRSGRCAAC